MCECIFVSTYSGFFLHPVFNIGTSTPPKSVLAITQHHPTLANNFWEAIHDLLGLKTENNIYM